jgi:hypothetical protein
MKYLKHLTKHHFWTLPAILIIDSIFFGSTDPARADSLYLIVGYLLMVASLICFLRLTSRVIGLYGVPREYSKRMADIVAVLGAVTLALSSVGELTSRDIIVMVPLGVLFYIYASYIRTRKI